MIEVQIASQVTLGGVDGVRWVLVETGDDGGAPALPPVGGDLPSTALPQAAPPAAGPGAPARLSLALLKLLVIGLAAGLALWLAQSMFGPVRLPWRSGTGEVLPAGERAPPPAVRDQPASAVRPLVTLERT